MVRNTLQMIAAGCGVLFVAGGAAVSAAELTVANAGRQLEADADISMTRWHVDAELILVLEKEASRKVTAYLQGRGRLRVVDVSVSINMDDRMILADFGPGFLPGPDEAEMFLHELAVTLRHYAEQAGLPIVGVDFRYQGKPLKYYYPAQLDVPLRARTDARNQTALVSASHGLVRVHPALNWDYQRPGAFGLRAPRRRSRCRLPAFRSFRSRWSSRPPTAARRVHAGQARRPSTIRTRRSPS